MIKCFLSHSSADKDSYVKIVADKIGKQFVEYDEYTFEEGMKPLDEIIKRLNESQLFVIFLSNTSLNSKWVQQEIQHAEKILAAGLIKRIFPLIIDRNINYKDKRIPDWMRDGYNLKLVTRPTVAARRIRQRLREISWQFHPRLLEREKIFVGRNEQIKEFEERIDDFKLPTPTCINASGIKHIGRRSFILHSFKKTNIIDSSYTPPSFSMTRHESIEDFILKINDLGISEPKDVSNMIEKDVKYKIDLCVEILLEFQNAKEMVLIIDDGCIINYDSDIENWFRDIIIKASEKLTRPLIAIVSSRRIFHKNIFGLPHVFSLAIPELNPKERSGLFKRLLEFEGINITDEDFEFFTGLLYGYPDQVIYLVDLIKDKGIREARSRSAEIQQFNAEKASIYIQKYNENEDALNFIYLLSEFEVISLDFLYEIAEEHIYSPILNDLIARCVVDTVGIEQEFIRLNDAVRDYIRRNRFEVSSVFKERLNKHVVTFVSSGNVFDRDISDIQYSVQKSLLEGKDIPKEYLIPSHFLITMRDLYHQRKHYDRIIELADIIFRNQTSLENTIKSDIQYYLCLALARKKSGKFLSEVQKVKGPEHNFLLGLYYRIIRKDSDALINLEKALASPSTATRAKRELVQVYLHTEQYDKAIVLAKESYDTNKDNPYHIQAYFNCLINSEGNDTKNTDELRKLIDELYQIGSEISVEMAKISEAIWFARCKKDMTHSLTIINNTIANDPRSPYALLAKFEIFQRFNNLDGMKETLVQMDDLKKRGLIYSESVTISKATYQAYLGDKNTAYELIDNGLQNFPLGSKNMIKKRIDKIIALVS